MLHPSVTNNTSSTTTTKQRLTTFIILFIAVVLLAISNLFGEDDVLLVETNDVLLLPNNNNEPIISDNIPSTQQPTTTTTTSSTESTSTSIIPTSLSTLQTILSSPTPPNTKNNNLNLLKNHFHSKRAIITQTDNRLFPILYQSITRLDRNFSTCSFTVGPLSLQRWAHEQNLGYLFFSSPTICTEPKSKSKLAPYWCKVPGMILVTKIAQLVGVPYVMFLDSDVVPADKSMKLENVLNRMDANPTIQFAVVPDTQHWSRLIHWNGVIYKKALNSGAILIRVGNKSLEMLDLWWNILTGMKSPFELQMSRVIVNIPVTLPEFIIKSNSIQLNITKFEKALANTLPNHGRSAKIQNIRQKPISNKINVPSSGLGVHVIVDLTPIPTFRDEFWEIAIPNCCLEPNTTCLYGFNPLELVPSARSSSFRCDRSFRDTLVGWPGDQDRLNWMQDQYDSLFTFETDLSRGCNHASSNLKGMLFNHVCFSENAKQYYSHITSMEMMAHDLQQEILQTSWGEVRQKWENEIGWNTIRKELISFAFDESLIKNQPVEKLLEMIDLGNFLVTNIW
jgi:hypothetical protein